MRFFVSGPEHAHLAVNKCARLFCELASLSLPLSLAYLGFLRPRMMLVLMLLLVMALVLMLVLLLRVLLRLLLLLK
jgi:hypothetical protein